MNRVYFIGIGGIGMSALARFFKEKGAWVGGYDRARTALTEQLEQEGMSIHYTDDTELLDTRAELVVYTPAIPSGHQELAWYRDNGFPVYKRSDVLQWITERMFAITIAGTHGKTTISTMVAHLLRDSGYGCNAFLGGISSNYDKNYWGSEKQVAVIEADEYDRSFLKLKPDIALLSALSPDHLDIYGTVESMEEAFIAYTRNLKKGGTLWYKYGIAREADFSNEDKRTYAIDNPKASVRAANVRLADGGYTFDVIGPDWTMADLHLGIGGRHNVENCTVAVAVAQQLGIAEGAIKKAVGSFKGVKRRFEYIVRTEQSIYIDDYAHHPEELTALIQSAKELYPARKCTIVFQPHLYSRTRDFANEFAESLDMADEIWLLDIYPARELPIEGVSIASITDNMRNPNHKVMTKEALLDAIGERPPSLLITAGAGDIDKLVAPIRERLGAIEAH